RSSALRESCEQQTEGYKVRPVEAQHVDRVRRCGRQRRPCSVRTYHEVCCEIVSAQIDEPDSSFLKKARRPSVALDMVTRMAGVVEIVEVPDQFGKQRTRAEMVQLEVLLAPGPDLLQQPVAAPLLE